MFRGFVQRQILTLSGSAILAIAAQAIIFGATHAYQGWRSVVAIVVRTSRRNRRALALQSPPQHRRARLAGHCEPSSFSSASRRCHAGEGNVGASQIGQARREGAAIANAVYNTTGKRVRDLPITIDKLLQKAFNHKDTAPALPATQKA